MKRNPKNLTVEYLLDLSSSDCEIQIDEVAADLIHSDLKRIIKAAQILRDEQHGAVISYSRKVFIPLTQLCRDSCHYCTFAQPPSKQNPPYMSPEQVLEIANAGAQAGCKEALFTLGDKPEYRYKVARDELAKLGHRSTSS